MALTKANLTEAVAEQNLFTRRQTQEIIETLLETIKHTLESGEDVLISGFGKFCVKDKRERRGRNPATGEYKLVENKGCTMNSGITWALRYLNNMSAIFGLLILWIYSSYMHSVLQRKCTLKMIILSFAALFSSQNSYIFLILKKILELVNF